MSGNIVKAPVPNMCEIKLKELLGKDDIKRRFQEMLGRKAPGFLSSIISAVKANKQLESADPMSVISAAAIAASLDLPINPSLGMAHIVPYRSGEVSIAQFQMGWKGFVQLAMRSGQYKTLNCSEVYDGEIAKHDPFTGEMTLKQSDKREKIIGYLLYFKLLNGFEKYFYMTKDECEKHAKRYSQTYRINKGKWVDDFDAMAKKTVVKMGLSKYGVLSIEMQNAIETDEGIIDTEGKVVEYPDNPIEEPTAPATTSNKLKDAMGIKTSVVEKKEEPEEAQIVEPKQPEETKGDAYEVPTTSISDIKSKMDTTKSVSELNSFMKSIQDWQKNGELVGYYNSCVKLISQK